MNDAKMALRLCEHFGIRPRAALNIVIEGDDDAIKAAAKEMAADIDDPSARKEAEKDFTAQLTKKAEQLKKEQEKDSDKKEQDDKKNEADGDKDKDKDEDDDKDKDDKDEDDDEPKKTEKKRK